MNGELDPYHLINIAGEISISAAIETWSQMSGTNVAFTLLPMHVIT